MTKQILPGRWRPDLDLALDLREPAAVVERAAELLTAEERAHAGAGTEAVRRRRTLSRAALRIVLARWLACAPAALRFATEPSGKPRLDEPGPHFSLSHSDDWSLIAVTSLGPIGIDSNAWWRCRSSKRSSHVGSAPAQAREILEPERRAAARGLLSGLDTDGSPAQGERRRARGGLDTTLSDPDPRGGAWPAVTRAPG